MKSWINPGWSGQLQQQGLDDLEHLWNMDLELVEKPNRERGGYSEVGRISPDGLPCSLYIKRQKNYTYRPVGFPLIRRSLCAREFDNLNWCQENQVLAPEPVAFMERVYQGERQAMLISAGLDDCLPLSDSQFGSLPRAVRDRLIRQAAKAVRGLHDKGMMHGCLYPKHLYANQSWLESGEGNIYFLDMERARPMSWTNSGIFRDLDTMNRRATSWSYRERMLFLKQYLGSKASQLSYWIGRLSASYQTMIDKDA